MRNKFSEFLVGVFIILGCTSLMIMILKVSGLSDFSFSQRGYNVTALFTDIGGLKVRSRVTMAGVDVGRVVDISLDQEFFTAKVTLNVKKEYQNIPLDSKLSILTSGLLGDNYISIDPGFSEEEFLKEGSTITIENTNKAIILEQLLSKMIVSK